MESFLSWIAVAPSHVLSSPLVAVAGFVAGCASIGYLVTRR